MRRSCDYLRLVSARTKYNYKVQVLVASSGGFWNRWTRRHRLPIRLGERYSAHYKYPHQPPFPSLENQPSTTTSIPHHHICDTRACCYRWEPTLISRRTDQEIYTTTELRMIVVGYLSRRRRSQPALVLENLCLQTAQTIV
jgi:hypothetical protein